MDRSRIVIGNLGRRTFATRPEHSAEAVGNSGVVVLSSASLIWFIETACADAIRDCYDEGEVCIGVGFNLTHLAPSAIGQPVDAIARVESVDGIKIGFEVTARVRDRIVMAGTHQRAVVDLQRFLNGAGL